jgi:streptogramin lyase
VRALVAVLLLVAAAAPAAAKLPSPPEEVRVVPVGQGPCGLAVRAGSLWIGVYETGRLLALDTRTGRRETSVRVGRYACRIAVGPAAVWVTRDNAGELVRVSRGSGGIRRVRVGPGVFDVTLAGGSVWATSFDTGLVVRLDPRTGAITRVYEDGPKPAGIARCGGSLWVGHGAGTTWLTRIDMRTHRVTRVDVVLEAPAWPRCVRGELWVTTPDSVLQVSPTTGRLLGHYELGGTPAEAIAGPDGLVWVTDKERSVVHRVDPVARLVLDSFPAGRGAYALARTGDAIWITSFAGDDVRRYVP